MAAVWNVGYVAVFVTSEEVTQKVPHFDPTNHLRQQHANQDNEYRRRYGFPRKQLRKKERLRIGAPPTPEARSSPSNRRPGQKPRSFPSFDLDDEDYCHGRNHDTRAAESITAGVISDLT